MMRVILILFTLFSMLFSSMTQHKMHASLSTQGKINFLDAKELSFRSRDAIEIKELSALAYKDNILYSLGDNGVLFQFELSIKNNTLEKIFLSRVLELKNENGKILKKSRRDSEGLTFIGKDLLISFERKARVDVFSVFGLKLKNKKIHKDLRKIKKYRSKNKALESVAYNLSYGVVTAPEKSLKGVKKGIHILYSQRNKWIFPASGSITALEFMSKNKIMILEREFNTFSRRRVVTISSLNLQNSKYEILAKLDSRDGWNLDNFEGLTKINKNQYLMISDDNDSFFQKTLLVLFEVL